MLKLTPNQLKTFKGANFNYKLTLCKKWKTTIEEVVKQYYPKNSNPKCLKDYLLTVTSSASTPSKSTKTSTSSIPSVHVINILDNSGSMGGSKFKNAINALKKELESLQKETNINYNYSLAYFHTLSYNSTPLIDVFNCPINNVKVNFNRINTNNNTPLYDTIISVLTKLNSLSTNDKVLIKIFTDGRDNNSAYSSLAKCKKLIDKAIKLDHTITFVGTEEDTDYISYNLNIDSSNTLSYENNAEGVKQAFETTSIATKNYSAKVVKGEDVSRGFYKGM